MIFGLFTLNRISDRIESAGNAFWLNVSRLSAERFRRGIRELSLGRFSSTSDTVIRNVVVGNWGTVQKGFKRRLRSGNSSKVHNMWDSWGSPISFSEETKYNLEKIYRIK